MTFQPGQNLYGVGVGSYAEGVEVPVVANRSPLSTDIRGTNTTANFPVGKRWIYSGNSEYVLVSYANNSGTLTAKWVSSTGASGGIDEITPFGESPVLPNPSGNVTFTSNDGSVTITGATNAIDFSALSSSITFIADNGGTGTPNGSDQFEIRCKPTVANTGGNSINTSITSPTNELDIIPQFAVAASSQVAGNEGLASFDSTNFSVTNGFVSLIASAEGFSQISVPSGTSPVLPNGSGNVTFTATGLTITGSTNAIAFNATPVLGSLNFATNSGTASPSASTININGVAAITNDGTLPIRTSATGSTVSIKPQFSVANASTGAGRAGVCSFDNNSFSVDANGWVQMNSTAIQTWTPTVRGAGVPGSATYTQRVGKYKIVGGVVFAEFTVVGTLSGSPTGNLQITGLPNTVNAGIPNVFGACIDVGSIPWPAGVSMITANIPGGSSTIIFQGSSSGGGVNIVQAANGGFNYQGSIFYPM